MSLPRLWTTSQALASDPFRAMRREMENALRAFDQGAPSPSIGARAPAINVAETRDAFEVTAELPGVDEKDIKVSLDGNQLVISGEKKAESTKDLAIKKPAKAVRTTKAIDIKAGAPPSASPASNKTAAPGKAA
jgi:HSP20 family protein